MTVSSETSDGELLLVEAIMSGLINNVQASASGNAVSSVQTSPAIVLNMTVSPNPAEEGGQLYYALTVSNTSDLVLQNVDLQALLPDYINQVVDSDMVSGGGTCRIGYCDDGEVVTWSLGDLSPGEVRTVHMTPQLYSAIPDGTILRSEATASYSGGSATTVRDVMVKDSPPLSLSITEDVDPVSPGGLVKYNIRIRNRSALDLISGQLVVTLPEETIFDSASDGGTPVGNEIDWGIGGIAAGGEINRRFSLTVSSETSDGELLLVEAIMSGLINNVQASASGNAVSSVQTSPAIVLNMTVSPNPAEEGGQLYYALTVSNTSDLVLQNVDLQALLPDYINQVVDGDMVSGGGTCRIGYCDDGEVVTWSLGDLSPGEVRTVHMTPQLYSAIPDGTILRSEATASYSGGSATTVRDVLVKDAPPLSLSITESADPVSPGGLVTYNIRIRNRSALDLISGQLVVTLPEETIFDSASDGGTPVGNEIDWGIGGIAAGGEINRRFSLTVSSETSDGELLLVEAIMSGLINNVQASASGNAVSSVQTSPAIVLNMTVSPNPAEEGGQLYYALTVSNTSDLVLQNVDLQALLPDYINQVVDGDMVSGGGTCRIGYCDDGEVVTWSLGDLSPGEVRTVHMTPQLYSAIPDGTILRSEATASYSGGSATTVRDVMVKDSPPLSLSITEDVDPVSPGGLVKYNIRIRNRSALDLISGQLVVTVPEGVRPISGGGLLAGKEVHWTINEITSSNEVDFELICQIGEEVVEGTILFSEAVATGIVNNVHVGASGNAISTVKEFADISLQMTAWPYSIQQNEAITYTLKIQNVSDLVLQAVDLQALLPDYINQMVDDDMVSGGGTCRIGYCDDGEVVTWSLGDIAPGEVRTVHMTPQLYSTIPDGTILRSEATASYSGGSATAVRDIIVGGNLIVVPADSFSLILPLKGYSSQTIPISSVFDHAMTSSYAKDTIVTSYTQETGDSNMQAPGCDCYDKSNGQPFNVNGYYTGDSSCGGENYLCYDGHPGTDFPVIGGTPVYAAADGVAHIPTTFPGINDAQSYNTVEIDHLNGYKTYYLHLQSRNVIDGQQVYKGQTVIGYSGNVAPEPVGYHLHFEVQLNGVPVDPYGWLGAGSDPYLVESNINLWNDATHVNVQDRPEQSISDTVVGVDKKAVVVTHGYLSDVEGWILDDIGENGLADKICKNLGATIIKYTDYAEKMTLRCTTDEWHVYAYDWRKKAATKNILLLPDPILAYTEAFDQGEHLGEILSQKGYSHIHMLAHSAGANLINTAKTYLKIADPDVNIHLSFFDAYDPFAQLRCGEQISNYGQGADYVDNYFDSRTLDTLFIGKLDGTKLNMPYAYNIDVTKWDRRDEPLPPAAVLFRHEWPYLYYKDLTFLPMTYDLGYQLSLENGTNYPPVGRDHGTKCILSDWTPDGQTECESIQSVCSSTPVSEDAKTIGDSDVVINQVSSSVFGIVDLFQDPMGLIEYWFLDTSSTTDNYISNTSLILESAPDEASTSSTWSKIDLDLTIPVDSLGLNFQFLSADGAEGYVTIFFDGNVVGRIDERTTPLGIQQSPRFALGDITSGLHTLSIRVDSFTTVPSAIKLTNIMLYKRISPDLSHAILALQALTGNNQDLGPLVDINGDEKVGLAEVIEILRVNSTQ